MIGAILGDMIGAPYEFDLGGKTKNFPLFSSGSDWTDDTVMTIAVCDALMTHRDDSPEGIQAAVVRSMRKWGHRYPDASYGSMFWAWLQAEEPRPYGSFGNGSAMRVSSAGWLFNSLERTREAARATAEVTHNHPEGIKGAEATASAIYLARTGHTKDEIMDYVIAEFGYDFSRTCDEIRPGYHHVETCQQTVPEALTAFLEGTDFEDVIRTAVSLGGDCDTLTCIAGGIAEAFYGVPVNLEAECRARLPEDMLEVLDAFEKARGHGPVPEKQTVKIASGRITLVKGDITAMQVDAIVNAANRSLLGGGGVDGAIHSAAGPDLLKECKTLNGCRTGEAKITKGYCLKARYVIHTVGPIYTGAARDAGLLSACYQNSLNLALTHEIHSIAFPAISAGAYGYPISQAAQIALKSVSEWLRSHPVDEMEVFMVCYDLRSLRAFQDALSACVPDR